MAEQFLNKVAGRNVTSFALQLSLFTIMQIWEVYLITLNKFDRNL